MSGGSRARYGDGVRQAAVLLFASDYGYRSVSRELDVPVYTVRRWWRLYKSVGVERMASGRCVRANYPYEVKLAVARAVVDDGVSKAEAMAQFGVASDYTLQKWCRLYREGGEEALKPRKRGRPRRP